MEEKHLDKTGLSFFWSKLKDLLSGKQDVLTGVAGQVVGFDANGKAIAQDAPSSGIEMVLLWENASPSSEFGAQKISLDLSNYDAVYVMGDYMTCGGYALMNCNGSLQSVNIWKSVEGINLSVRRFNVEVDGITFESGLIVSNAKNNTSWNYATNNTMCPPNYIYGIKGVS